MAVPPAKGMLLYIWKTRPSLRAAPSVSVLCLGMRPLEDKTHPMCCLHKAWSQTNHWDNCSNFGSEEDQACFWVLYIAPGLALSLTKASSGLWPLHRCFISMLAHVYTGYVNLAWLRYAQASGPHMTASSQFQYTAECVILSVWEVCTGRWPSLKRSPWPSPGGLSSVFGYFNI